MAEPLKNLYSTAFISDLAKELKKADPKFNPDKFQKDILNKDWLQRELKDRTLHIANSMMANLPYNYQEQITILKKVAPHFSGFCGTIFPTTVEHYGLAEPTISLEALAYFTTYSTSEFAIRPFLARDPSVIKTLYKWSKSDNYHVRRLASEGCRPLLPWAMKLQQYVIDPSPILPIIEELKNDSEDYVYRSVANNLNDISKHHPDLVLNICEKWINESKTTRWVAKHALRTLLKKGNQRAMRLFGFGEIKALAIVTFAIEQQTVIIGNATQLNVAVKNNGNKAQFRLEYAIGYLKKNGQHNEKVFQLREKLIDKEEELTFTKKLDFKNLSTRKHYAGKHYVVLKVNGNVLNKISFELFGES